MCWMICLLSPAKTFTDTLLQKVSCQKPLFEKETKDLIRILNKYSVEDIQKLMKLSENLSVLNVERYKTWGENKKQAALLSFYGDVYKGLGVEDFTQEDLAFSQGHIGILSGLYGFIRPLDEISPYRLEMGTKLANKAGKNLYAFWSGKITEYINQLDANVLINLASKEYSSVINLKTLTKPVIEVIFKEKKGDTYKIVAIYAKKARGMMARYIVKNRCKKAEELKQFCDEGYQYEPSLSTNTEMVFIR